jgi:preprotein translocase subunit YajC
MQFPRKAKVIKTGKEVVITGGQLGQIVEDYIKYQSDYKDGYKVYKPNEIEFID